MAAAELTVTVSLAGGEPLSLPAGEAVRLMNELIGLFPGAAVVRLREVIDAGVSDDGVDWLGWDSVQT